MTDIDIQAFLVVNRVKTISRAAESLFISPSTLSWRISRLEGELGEQLFRRSKGVKQAELTQAGSQFLPYAEMIWGLWQEARQAMSSTAVKAFNIVIANGFNLLFENIYTLFCGRYPDVIPHIVLRHMDEAYELVGSERAEVGFTATACEDELVRAVPLCDEREVLVCGSSSPLAPLERVSIKDLRTNECVRWWLEGSSIEQWTKRTFSGERITRVVQEDNNLLASSLKGSRCWSIIPFSTAQIFTERHDGILLKAVDFECPVRHMYLIVRKGYLLSPHIKDMLEAMKETFTARGMTWLWRA